MAFDNRLPPLDTTAANDPASRDADTREANGVLPDIVQQHPQIAKGRRRRQLMRWRVPGLGFVDMYINPQQLSISEKKITKRQRTKGGYIVQYWGEELIEITLSGTTGASSIEGINILRKVYRAEQDSFQQVAETLANRLQDYTRGNLLSGIVGQVASGGIGGAAGSILNNVLGGSANPPLLPTLGSLATAVELYYQGWVFKGYFESFNVDESTQNGVGVFQYNLKFAATDRRGIRTNFMPWSRSPATLDGSGNPVGYNKADASVTPLSFNGEENK